VADSIDAVFTDIPTRGARSNQYGPSIEQFQPGQIFKCRYMFWKHDPFPYVLCCRVDRQRMLVSGINFRYVLAGTIGQLVELLSAGTPPSLSNLSVSGEIERAYRSYKVNGLRQVRFADFEQLKQVAESVRSIDPHENEAIRQSVEHQLKQAVNPTASQVAKTPPPAPAPSGPQAPVPLQSATIPGTPTT